MENDKGKLYFNVENKRQILSFYSINIKNQLFWRTTCHILIVEYKVVVKDKFDRILGTKTKQLIQNYNFRDVVSG